jgi:hypothetical protein
MTVPRAVRDGEDNEPTNNHNIQQALHCPSALLAPERQFKRRAEEALTREQAGGDEPSGPAACLCQRNPGAYSSKNYTLSRGSI